MMGEKKRKIKEFAIKGRKVMDNTRGRSRVKGVLGFAVFSRGEK